MKALLTVEETASLLSVDLTELHDLMARGDLPVVRIGQAVRIPASAIEQRAAGPPFDVPPSDSGVSK